MATKPIHLNTLLLSAAGVLFVEFVLFWRIDALPGPPLLWLGLARIAQAAMMISAIQRREGGLSALGMGREQWPSGLKKGLGWSLFLALGAFSVLGVAQYLGQAPWPLIRTRFPSGSYGVGLYFLVGGVISPVSEELFFRGLLFGYFRRFGFQAALILSTTFFVLAHYRGVGIPLTQIVGGAVFALAYESTASLATPLVIHCLGNLTLFSLSWWVYS